MPIDIEKDSPQVALKKLKARENALRRLESVSNLGSWEVDLVSGKSYWSERSYEIYGYTPNSFEPSLETFFEHLLPEYHEKAKKTLALAMETKEVTTFQGRSRRKDGTVIDILLNAQVVADRKGKLLKIIGTTQDITDYMRLKRESQELLDIIERSTQEIYILDMSDVKYGYLYVNEGVVKQTGYTKEELYQMSVFDLNPYLTLEHARKIRALVMEHGSAVNKTVHRCKNGQEYPVQSYLQKIRFKERDAIIIFDTNISELEKLEEELFYQAYHDPLTGLPNRHYFEERLEEEILISERKNTSFALLFIDLDRFKEVNDTMGHHYGDKVLVECVNRIKGVVRGIDTFARLGGDEFTIILRDMGSPEDANIVAQKIIDVLKPPFKVGKKEFFISGSIGISVFPQDTKKASELIKFADTAMYEAKNGGKACFRFYNANMTEAVQKRIQLENALRQAIQDKAFEVYFQPQIDVEKGKIVGVEALIRWEQEGKILSPDLFIPFAEEIGLIAQIDRVVMEKAMRRFVTWKKRGYGIEKLSLNLATKQLIQKDFFTFIETTAQKTGFDLFDLELELTESDLMHDPLKSIETLRKLNEKGIQIAMDDFGTGYSSLAYLKRLPLDLIKIDKSFVLDLHRDKENKEIVSTIVTLAKSLRFDIIAEGVEMQEHKEILLAMGCKKMQGFHFQRPLPFTDFVRFL